MVVAGQAVYGDPVWDNAGTKVAITIATILSIEPGKETFNIWTFSYEKPGEEEKVIEEVGEVRKNIFQKIWETIINFFRRIFRIIRIK